jgi:hypothetical protein
MTTELKTTSKIRRCSICQGIGHNAKRCPSRPDPEAEARKIDWAISQYMKHVTVFIPQIIIEIINELVEKGFFKNRSEFIRQAVSSELKDFGIDFSKYLDDNDNGDRRKWKEK